ncbi:MAG: hypothetical protein Q4G65_11040 [bacterium]|nr:hypothetical protein [bacterium]
MASWRSFIWILAVLVFWGWIHRARGDLLSAIAQTPQESWSYVLSMMPSNGPTPRVYFNPELRSAAPSRGKLDDDRPHVYTYGFAELDCWQVGAFGVGYWSDTALTHRLREKFRNALYENDAIPYWRYIWHFTDDWSLRNDFMFNFKWFEFEGVYRQYRDFYTDFCYYGRLENPYLVPFTLLRRMLASDDRFDFRIGLTKTVPVWDRLSLTATVYADGGNSEQVRLRYGRRLKGGEYAPGVNAVVCQLFFNYALADYCSLYAGIEQFDILRGSARDRIDASPDPWAKCDMTMFVCGLRVTL